jgi:23S rRNA (pseudouridine1915-N3)-methyltransferase
MEITILAVGKTSEEFVINGVNEYLSRLKHYCKVNFIIIPENKHNAKLSTIQKKERESLQILSALPNHSCKVLLDEKGKELTSVDFSIFIQKQMNSGIKRLVFIIGGANGVAKNLKDKVDFILSLSTMTFTHQFIRVMLTEQVYRAYTILNNELYHNE